MTLDDIPQGAFVCCYAGQVYPGHLADEKAMECGDDYQAELDYIGQFLHGLNDKFICNEVFWCYHISRNFGIIILFSEGHCALKYNNQTLCVNS